MRLALNVYGLLSGLSLNTTSKHCPSVYMSWQKMQIFISCIKRCVRTELCACVGVGHVVSLCMTVPTPKVPLIPLGHSKLPLTSFN